MRDSEICAICGCEPFACMCAEAVNAIKANMKAEPDKLRIGIGFEGKHEPTGYAIALEMSTDGRDCMLMNSCRCPVCSDDGSWTIHTSFGMGSRSAAQCRNCKSWFVPDSTPGTIDEKQLTLTLEGK